MINAFLKAAATMLLLTSCATTRINGTKVADELAINQGFKKQEIKGGDFFITTYEKIKDPKMPYVIYIEGDGKIVSGDFISKDPTPTKPMLINLAFVDPRPNVIYMGRPCQYTSMDRNTKCSKEYWTNKRLSEETIVSMNEAINKITNNKKFDLVGFSGGGAASILIAARNANVTSVLTLAGNLDILAFTKHHKSSPMNESLNPVDWARQVQNIPQLHISGGQDRTVPTFIAQNFMGKINTPCAKHMVIEKAQHNKYWDEYWAKILQTKITCAPNI